MKIRKKWAKCEENNLEEENFTQLRRGNKRTPTQNYICLYENLI